jgi:hypothetical protein
VLRENATIELLGHESVTACSGQVTELLPGEGDLVVGTIAGVDDTLQEPCCGIRVTSVEQRDGLNAQVLLAVLGPRAGQPPLELVPSRLIPKGLRNHSSLTSVILAGTNSTYQWRISPVPDRASGISRLLGHLRRID